MTNQTIFTNLFSIQNAKNFERFVTGTFGNTYIAIGKNTDWNANDTPTIPTDTANTYYNFWRTLVGLKKITSADINLVIPRVDWTANTKYVEYTQDQQLFYKANTANVAYDNKFYVRNTKDQVFKCLSNNFSANSTTMPEINIDGQLPENPFITYADGYKWKYMYTIPPGLKSKFFTRDFMPIVSEAIVTNNAEDGRLDIIQIVSGGAGFNANANSNTLSIASITGDGSNANITLRATTTAANGANIVDYTIIEGGSNYRNATITITDPLKIAGTANANLIAIIGPPGGHGSAPEKELGASNLMICVELEGDESGVLPILAAETHEIRQVGILLDPRFEANNAYLSGSVYRTTMKFNMTQPNRNFSEGETVYVGSTVEGASFRATVEHYNPSTFALYLTDVYGTISPPASLIGDSSGALATVLSVEEPVTKKYSGDLLYIDNSSPILRSPTETVQFKITLRF